MSRQLSECVFVAGHKGMVRFGHCSTPASVGLHQYCDPRQGSIESVGPACGNEFFLLRPR